MFILFWGFLIKYEFWFDVYLNWVKRIVWIEFINWEEIFFFYVIICYKNLVGYDIGKKYCME